MDDYFDIEFDWDDTIFKVEEFYWYINQVDGNFYVETFFPRIKLSATYKDFFRSFDDALFFGNGEWGVFVYKEDLNNLE